jgi:hypothetical protein
MTRAWQFAEDRDWKEAAEYFNKVLDTDPSYAPAFLGLLCVDLTASKEDNLSAVKDPNSIIGHKYYKRAIADPAIKSQLDGYVQTINARIDAEQKAVAAALRNKYGVLLDRLSPKGKAQAGQRRQAAQSQLDEENKKAQADVEAKCAQIKQKHDADHKAWQEEYNRLKAPYNTKYKKWENDKAQAESRKSQGLCPHCGGTLKGLFSKKCSDCGKVPSEPIKTPPAPAQPNYPTESKMPQVPTYTPRVLDESKYVLKEDSTSAINQHITLAGIEWRILDVQGDKLLLISEKILEQRPYNIEEKDITWENCTLRKYLNNEFYNKLGVVKPAIAETRNSNPSNQWYGTAGGRDTVDKVFLLSLEELVKYFGNSGDFKNKRRKDHNGNVSSDGCWIHDQYNSARIANYGSEGACWWWLRSPGFISGTAADVDDVGYVFVYGLNVNYESGGVRPAFWLNL